LATLRRTHVMQGGPWEECPAGCLPAVARGKFLRFLVERHRGALITEKCTEGRTQHGSREHTADHMKGRVQL